MTFSLFSSGDQGAEPPGLLVPTLRVGMHLGMLRVPCHRPFPGKPGGTARPIQRDAERPGRYSHAERGNEGDVMVHDRNGGGVHQQAADERVDRLVLH
jgi:hypothetical protein